MNDEELNRLEQLAESATPGTFYCLRCYKEWRKCDCENRNDETRFYNFRRILADSVPALIAALRTARAENERLTAAIKAHRLNVWGNTPVEHYEDVELYKAVGEK